MHSSVALVLVFGCALQVSVRAATDHYAVLGVDRDATPQQIKQAFRKLSLKWHPDMHQTDKDKAQEKFIQIGAAHDVLRNATKRATYDVYGQQGVDNDWFVDPTSSKSENFGTTTNSGTGSEGKGFGTTGHAGFGHGFSNGFGNSFGNTFGSGYGGAGKTANTASGASSYGQGSGGFGTGQTFGSSYIHTGYDSVGNPIYTAIPTYGSSGQYAQYNQYGQYGQHGASGVNYGYGNARFGAQGFGNVGTGAGYGNPGFDARYSHFQHPYYANTANDYSNYYGPAPPSPPPPPVPAENLFGQGLPGLQELTDMTWAEMLEDNALRRSVVVLFYRNGVAGANSLKDMFVEFGEKFAVPGIVELGVVNCGRLADRCALELGTSNDRLPVIRYYGPNSAEPVDYLENVVDFKMLSVWTTQIMADYCQVIRSMRDLDKWLTADDDAPKVLLFTERRVTPPLLQALSVEFLFRASLAVAFNDPDHDDISSAFGVHHKPSLVHVLDEATLEVEKFDREFERENLSGFISGAVARHKSAAAVSIRELTAKRYEAGTCGPSDPLFCLLLLACPRGEGSLVRSALRAISHHLKNEPVKIFFTHSHAARRSFGLAAGSVVLLRPKRERFKAFTGDTTNPNALLDFAQNTISEGAPLPSRVLAAMDLRGSLADMGQGCYEDPVVHQAADSGKWHAGEATSENLSDIDIWPLEQSLEETLDLGVNDSADVFTYGSAGAGDLFADSLSVEELSGRAWQRMIEDDSAHRNAILIFYSPDCTKCDALKQAMEELGNSFAKPGLMRVGSVNCRVHSARCEEEIDGHTLPFVRYYGPGGSRPIFKGSSLSYTSLMQWALHVQADYTHIVMHEEELRSWLQERVGSSKVLLFTSQGQAPPLLKALSVEFAGEVELAVVPVSADNDIANSFGVSTMPTLLHVRGAQSDRFPGPALERSAVSAWLCSLTLLAGPAGPTVQQEANTRENADADGKMQSILWAATQMELVFFAVFRSGVRGALGI